MKRSYFIRAFFFGFLLFTLSSCLKDKSYDSGQIQAISNSSGTNEKIVEMQLTATSADNFYHTSFNNSNNDTVVDFVPIVLATANPAGQDVHVTVTLNPSLVNDYNNANGTSYQIPSSSLYTIVNPGGVVTIPAGSNRGFLQIKFKPANFIGTDWALGFSISKVDGGFTVSGNLNNGIVAFGIKNKYDGIYSLTIKTSGWAAYGISDNKPATYPGDFQVISAGSSSVTLYNDNSGNLQPALTSTGGPTAFGATTPIFVFDPVTDRLTSVSNTTPDDGRGRTLQLNSAVTTSRYDPVSKIIYAAYIMKQNGRPDQAIYDTLIYLGPR